MRKFLSGPSRSPRKHDNHISNPVPVPEYRRTEGGFECMVHRDVKLLLLKDEKRLQRRSR